MEINVYLLVLEDRRNNGRICETTDLLEFLIDLPHKVVGNSCVHPILRTGL